MGNFHKDIKRGEIGERIVAEILWERQPITLKKAVGNFAKWDYKTIDKTIEVKYDEMSLKTGNICFEASDDKKITGVFASEADEIWYVVPTKIKNKYEIFVFERFPLLDWLEKNPSSIRFVNGGDNFKFTLLLVKKNILIDNIQKLGEHFEWVEPQN